MTPTDQRNSNVMKVFWFFFSKKNRSSFVNNRAHARPTERSKKLYPFFMFLLFAAPGAHAQDSDALWKIISQRCVPGQVQRNDPAPCAEVNLEGGEAKGFVLLKDRDGATQFLVMPTAKITGIESPDILAPDATNYFAVSWREHAHMDAVAHRAFPRDAVTLAINSMTGRSQNQLHIHIDCGTAELRDALAAHRNAVGESWAPFPVPLAGHPYLAMRVMGESLDGVNPFRLLADGVAGAAADMGHQTLVAAATVFADGKPGFVLLTDHSNLPAGDRASGEELQDHSCHAF